VTVAATKRLTADEFMALAAARDCELIDVQLVERKPMGRIPASLRHRFRLN
jgi:hypothetical protein